MEQQKLLQYDAEEININEIREKVLAWEKEQKEQKKLINRIKRYLKNKKESKIK